MACYLLLSVSNKPCHFIRLNKVFKSDMAWWKTFAEGWNGISIMLNAFPSEVFLTSDASGAWGCGAYSGNMWFQLEWDEVS